MPRALNFCIQFCMYSIILLFSYYWIMLDSGNYQYKIISADPFITRDYQRFLPVAQIVEIT
jgi:hypothetical protein